MNWKTWLPLILAVALGLVAAKVARDIVVRKGVSATGPKLAQVVIANRDLEPGQTISEADLQLGSISASNIPRNSFKSTGDLVGRVALQPIVKDQPILEMLLAPEGSLGGPQALVPKDKRIASIEVTEATGVAGLLVPGCRVDVVATFQESGEAQRVTRIIAQNVRVLAVGQRILGAKREEEDPSRAKTVSLIVSPNEAELISLASELGRLRLLLRGPLDNETQGGAGVTVAELAGRKRGEGGGHRLVEATTRPVVVQPQIVVQRPKVEPKPRRRIIEVITAGKRSTVELDDPLDSGSALSGDESSKQVLPGQDR